MAGNRTHLVYPTGQIVTYTYDADNRLVGVEDWDSGLTAYEYASASLSAGDGAGRLVSTGLPNRVRMRV